MSASSVFICGEKRLPGRNPLDMVHKFFVAFIPIFVAIDAIGLVAMFMGLAGDTPRDQRQREGFIAIFTALCVSVGFIFLGKIIFTALGITVADFQVAGGLILLGLAGRELLNVAPASREATNDFGVVPLGMPLIAGPALLTALLVLVDTVGLVFTVAALLSILRWWWSHSGMPILSRAGWADKDYAECRK